MFDWSKIDLVLLDMDGTLLDLHFDNYFWQTHIPFRYAEQHNMPLAKAQQYIEQQTAQVAGQIEWYCLDYWEDKLQLPIVQLKREIQNKIALRDDTLPFLNALKKAKKDVILLTNAHPNSLSLKIEQTALHQHISQLISTHQYGVTKESQQLWHKLKADLQFTNESTLFVDDSLRILNSAKAFGIKHLLAVANPDSQQPAIDESQLQGYPFITDYRDIIADIVPSKNECE